MSFARNTISITSLVLVTGCLAVSGTRAIRGTADIRWEASPYHSSRESKKSPTHFGNEAAHGLWSSRAERSTLLHCRWGPALPGPVPGPLTQRLHDAYWALHDDPRHRQAVHY